MSGVLHVPHTNQREVLEPIHLYILVYLILHPWQMRMLPAMKNGLVLGVDGDVGVAEGSMFPTVETGAATYTCCP